MVSNRKLGGVSIGTWLLRLCLAKSLQQGITCSTVSQSQLFHYLQHREGLGNFTILVPRPIWKILGLGTRLNFYMIDMNCWQRQKGQEVFWQLVSVVVKWCSIYTFAFFPPHTFTGPIIDAPLRCQLRQPWTLQCVWPKRQSWKSCFCPWREHN